MWENYSNYRKSDVVKCGQMIITGSLNEIQKLTVMSKPGFLDFFFSSTCKCIRSDYY